VTASEIVELLPGDEAYVPRIEIIVADQRVSDDVLGDVIELKVTLQRDELGGFTLQLANHFEVPEHPPTRAQRVPGMGTAGPEDSAAPPVMFRHSDDPRFDVFKPISIQMGYGDRLVSLFIGEITMLQPTFPSSGMPTFTVTGTDILQRLRRSKPSADRSRAFDHLADWEIARSIARRHGLGFIELADRGLSSRAGARSAEPVMQGDKDDLGFVLYLAKRNDFECRVLLVDNVPKLYFGPATDKRDGAPVKQLALTYGESLISFTPKLTIGSQVAKVTVRGWNARTKKMFEYTATDKDLPNTRGTGTTGPALVAKQLGAKEGRIVDRPVQRVQRPASRSPGLLGHPGAGRDRYPPARHGLRDPPWNRSAGRREAVARRAAAFWRPVAGLGACSS